MNYKSEVLEELLPILEAAPVIDLEHDLCSARAIPVPENTKSSDVRTTSHTIKGPESDLLMKIYQPINRVQEKVPGLFWIHGGGYVLGHPDVEDGICERFAVDSNCVVVSVNYRLAPEYPYPAAIEDCYAGLKWMADNAEAFNIDKSKIAIAGPSAGGGLTAALALMACDKGKPEVMFQMPLYPMIDDRNETPSSYEINEKSMPKAWNRENNLIAWRMYLGDHVSDEISPYAAPTRANDLSGLPPAYICVGQLDPFRDETINYVTRLAQAGVPVEFHLYPGCFHGFDAICNNAKISIQARNEYINALKKAFHETEDKFAVEK